MNKLSIEELEDLRIEAALMENSGVVAAIDELIELKGDQVPVAWFTDDKEVDKSATTYSEDVARRWLAKGWPVGELFTAPQKPVVKLAGDMPRAPFNYGMFAKGWNDRGLADKLAIEAAGGIVKDGE